MSALEQLVANMTVAQLAEAAGLSVDEVVALVLRRSRTRGSPSAAGPAGSASDGRSRRDRAAEPLMPRAGEIVTDPATSAADAARGAPGRRTAPPKRRKTKAKKG